MAEQNVQYNAENIDWPFESQSFDIEECMRLLGRGSRETRKTVSREEIEPLLISPYTDPSFDAMTRRWKYDGAFTGASLYDCTKFNIAINRISHWVCDGTIRNGDSYFSAVAMLMYGDANLWARARCEHLQYFKTVYHNKSHTRNALYKKMNDIKTGANQFTLYQRLKIPNCWVDHGLIQQVTADLYGIFLIIFSSHEAVTSIQARGIYEAPHRSLYFDGKSTYSPCIPDVGHPSKHRFPEILFQHLKVFGMTGLKREGNYGLLHPWRRPLPDTRVPDELNPTPIAILGQLNTRLLENIIWVDIEKHDKTIGNATATSEEAPGPESSMTGHTGSTSEPPRPETNAQSLNGLGVEYSLQSNAGGFGASQIAAEDTDKEQHLEEAIEVDGQLKNQDATITHRIELDEKLLKLKSIAEVVVTGPIPPNWSLSLGLPESMENITKNMAASVVKHNRWQVSHMRKLVGLVSADSFGCPKGETTSSEDCSHQSNPGPLGPGERPSSKRSSPSEEDGGSSSEPDSPQDPASPTRTDWFWSSTTTKMIRQEAKRRVPPIHIPPHTSAREVKSTFAYKLKDLDDKAKIARDLARAYNSGVRHERERIGQRKKRKISQGEDQGSKIKQTSWEQIKGSQPPQK